MHVALRSAKSSSMPKSTYHPTVAIRRALERLRLCGYGYAHTPTSWSLLRRSPPINTWPAHIYIYRGKHMGLYIKSPRPYIHRQVLLVVGMYNLFTSGAAGCAVGARPRHRPGPSRASGF